MTRNNTASHAASAIDRRATPRVELCVGVGFSSETNFYTGFTEDLSAGGLFVATHALLPIGTSLNITFWLPDGHEVTTVGVVRWVRNTRDYNDDAGPGMGVQFRGLRADDADAIREFIALREPIFYAQ